VKVTFLGTGTSVGVPAIACPCAVCTSDDPRNKRLRSSIAIEEDGRRILVDSSVDLRQQALREKIDRLDAILYTHAHADHMLGLDEVRIFNFRQRTAMPAYGSAHTLAGVKKTFWYVFEETPVGGGKPHVDLRVFESPGEIAGFQVVPFPIDHGGMRIQGYRIGGFAYITDCLHVPEESHALLKGLDTLVINALRHTPHPTHQTLEHALLEIERIAPRRAFLTHIAHELDHAKTEAALPPHVRMAYDGLTLEF
jgi:phosphoribosyl 1,2-cyclic phosphate phosphodiesterase